MSFFKNIKFITDSIAKTASSIAGTLSSMSNEEEKVNKIKNEIKALNEEIEAAYIQIGRRFVNYVIHTKEMPGIDIRDILNLLDPKLMRKSQLEEELVKLEEKINNIRVIQEKLKAEEEFIEEKDKLDRGLKMNLISKKEYDEKLVKLNKKLNAFEEIQKIEHQYDLGIIDFDEMESKINKLLDE
ncbi:hypothetical protein [Clostridium tarantellae]|uniref:Uncharacterized protein n=1 Tax=Clostridium tarantellae TaxID=39493 RepID=A0A6I1MP66_9CLOT|nr:hypothetical protein [Clostridium tarantellae]MPQ44022.1 hypothetical protein [Clostridium tarantellae]